MMTRKEQLVKDLQGILDKLARIQHELAHHMVVEEHPRASTISATLDSAVNCIRSAMDQFEKH